MKSNTVIILAIFCLLLFTPLLSQGRGLMGSNHTSTAAYDNETLRKGVPFEQQLKKAHAIYEIKYDFDLRGERVEIPSDCILKFDGGHLTNGSIKFDGTIIESAYSDVFDQVTVSGSLANREVWVSWWKLEYNREANDAILVNQIINSIDNCIFYYDIKSDVYVGTDKTDGSSEETIAFLDKQNLSVIQPTQYYTILRGRSKTGSVVRCINNQYISIDGLKVDGGNVYYKKWGENGIGVVGNEKVLIENCIIRNCYSNCFHETTSGDITNRDYPSWGAGGKGIQIEGGNVSTQATIRNNTIKSSYIGISNNASDLESITLDGNYIDSCYMSLVLLRLNKNIKMNVNVCNTIISNNTGDVGVICMGDVSNVNIINTQIKGSEKKKSILRGCYSYSNIQLTVNQPCECLIDAALFRDNPEGRYAKHNYVKLISDQVCDNIVNTTGVIPKKGGYTYAEYVESEFDIILPNRVKGMPLVLPYKLKFSTFNIREGGVITSGDMEAINRINSNK